MGTLGKIFSDKEFNEIIHEIETKENGYLELDKFLNLMADIKTEENALKIEQTNLINTFAYLDRNQNVIIDYNEFKHILIMIPKKFSSKEVQKLDELCRSSVNENGQFKYRDFLELILLR